MPLQLTAEIQHLLREARADAMQRGHGELLAEHLLRAMARHKESSKGLRVVGVDILRLVDELERFLGERAGTRRWWRPRTPEAEPVLRRAIERAAALTLASQQEVLRPGDVLAALFLEPGCFAVESLRGQGLSRVDLLRYLEHGRRRDDPVWRPVGMAILSEPGVVVLHNDRYTPMEFVVQVLRRVFGHAPPEAERIMRQVHEQGRGRAATYQRAIAATRAQQAIGLAEQAGHPLLCTVEAADAPA
jgi:ATP-dependent Clp protease adaptor protein ClpS